MENGAGDKADHNGSGSGTPRYIKDLIVPVEVLWQSLLCASAGVALPDLSRPILPYFTSSSSSPRSKFHGTIPCCPLTAGITLRPTLVPRVWRHYPCFDRFNFVILQPYIKWKDELDSPVMATETEEPCWRSSEWPCSFKVWSIVKVSPLRPHWCSSCYRMMELLLRSLVANGDHADKSMYLSLVLLILWDLFLF